MKQKLTPEIAKKFTKELFKSKMHGLERKFIIRHSEGVVKTSIKLAKNKNVDIKKLIIASWLHDVGRVIQVENHAEESVKIIEKEFGELDEVIKDCILNHGTSKNPKTQEGKIIQFADKLSILNDYNLIEMIFSKPKYHQKSIKSMEMFCKDFLEILRKYKW